MRRSRASRAKVGLGVEVEFEVAVVGVVGLVVDGCVERISEMIF